MSQFAVGNEWCFCSSKKQREEWWGEKQNGSFSCISSCGMKIHCVTVAESPTSIVFFLLSALSGVGGCVCSSYLVVVVEFAFMWSHLLAFSPFLSSIDGIGIRSIWISSSTVYRNNIWYGVQKGMLFIVVRTSAYGCWSCWMRLIRVRACMFFFF